MLRKRWQRRDWRDEGYFKVEESDVGRGRSLLDRGGIGAVGKVEQGEGTEEKLGGDEVVVGVGEGQNKERK